MHELGFLCCVSRKLPSHTPGRGDKGLLHKSMSRYPPESPSIQPGPCPQPLHFFFLLQSFICLSPSFMLIARPLHHSFASLPQRFVYVYFLKLTRFYKQLPKKMCRKRTAQDKRRSVEKAGLAVHVSCQISSPGRHSKVYQLSTLSYRSS